MLSIIGGGAWGTALGKSLASNFKTVKIFAVEPEVVVSINKEHINKRYLPNVALPHNVSATNNLQDLVDGKIFLVTTPTQYIRKVLANIHYKHNAIFLICAKGIENTSGKLISQILGDLGISNIGVLSGPSFASETAQDLPTALVLASKSYNENLMQQLTTANIRTYYSNDIIGCQIGGAIKNVVAIAGGIIKGAALGHNALAALVSRGLHEILVLNEYFGGESASIFGLTGLGDLMLTATSETSRNYSLGYAIGKLGKFDVNLLNDVKGVAEGYYTTKILQQIMQDNNLNMPICKEVFEICYNHKTVKMALQTLMQRPLKQEFKPKQDI